jgi:hypothetical protein
MDKNLQDKFRLELMETYLKSAFEALGNYSFYGRRYSVIEKQVVELEKKQGEYNDKIKIISELPDNHTKQNKDLIKQLKKDVETFDKQIESVSGAMKKVWEEAVGWQEKGSRLLDMAENFKEFKLKTLEEIEADKLKKNEVESAKK